MSVKSSTRAHAQSLKAGLLDTWVEWAARLREWEMNKAESGSEFRFL